MLIKFFESKLYVHFIVWFIFTFAAFYFTFVVWLEPKEFNLARIVVGLSVISTIFAGMATLLIYSLRQSQEYYRLLEIIEEKAKNAFAPKELINARDEVVDLIQKRSSHRVMTEAARRVIALINARLKYEFKLPTKL